MYSKGHGGNIYDEAINYDFSVNTNPLGMPEDVKEKLKENLGDICEVYPEETCYELRKSISLKENISEHQIICGNGASELIYGLVRAIRPQKALVVVPSFSEYIRALRAEDTQMVYYHLAPERDFIVAEDIMSYLTPDIDMVFLCNPNNPTGKLIDPDLMLDIITYCRMNQIYVVIDECFMVNMPNQKTPTEVKNHVPSPKLFKTLQEAGNWGKVVNVRTVGALNEIVANGGASNLILVQEALQEKKIAQIAEKIAGDASKKFVMIAGPSSSGKTSFSHRLSIQLRTFGITPHPISLDNYFKNREDTPIDENGNYDFECLEAIDVEQFNKDMTALLAGETVQMPVFNFLTGHREYKGDFLKLGKDDILVLEGIHGLNDKLSYSLPKESKFKIYISALTQLNIDEHNRISTTDGRLIRRMVRDARTRGSSAAKTISMWPSVRRGEDKYIFPFQEEADVMFNSALIYELAVLKPYAEAILFGIPKDAPEYIEAKRLLKFLDYFLTISSEGIPKNSLMREFVGGSVFNV